MSFRSATPFHCCFFFVLLGLAGCTLSSATSEVLPTLQATAVPAGVAATSSPPGRSSPPPSTATPVPTSTPAPTETPLPTAEATATPQPTPTPLPFGAQQVVGYSVLERPIHAYRFGTGETPLVFVGGMHGGYEWNTIVLAYKALDYFRAHPEAVPEDVTLYIIPAANPDGQYTVTFQEGRFAAADIPAGTDTTWGRFNANGVDLNRNWDCNWQPAGRWRERIVSGGEAPFSEPETVALRDFFLELKPAAVIFWHSAANGVYTSRCGGEVDPGTRNVAATYSAASRYPLRGGFNAYEITGDAGDWLAAQGIPSITVELRNHDDIDWEKNLAGMTAVLDQYR